MNVGTKLIRYASTKGILSNTLKRFYRAASLNNFNEPLEIIEHKDKTPHDHEVLIEVANAGFNMADLRMIDGQYHLKPNIPFVPGFEVSGTVLSVGKGVNRFKEGDRVIALRPEGTGAFAEHCMLSSTTDIIITIPYSLSFDLATCLPVSYGTAYMILQKMATERQGSSVLILASRGTIGMSTIDLAQNVFKAQVFGASDTEEKLSKIRATGVHSTFNWNDKNFLKELKKVTFDKGVDVIIDTVGGKQFEQALAGLKVGGYVISAGFSSGIIPSISLLDLHRSQATVCGIWLGGRPQLDVENVLNSVISLYDEGYLNVSIEKRYPLEKINDCIKDIKEENVFGKLLIDMH